MHLTTIKSAAFFLLLTGFSCVTFAAAPVEGGESKPAMVAALAGSVAVVANPNHEQMLASFDEKLARNKRVVYDFWREVFEGGHPELADKYLLETYVQHNPNVPTGLAGFVDFFSRFAKPKPIENRVKGKLVAIVAEGDFVILSFVSENKDPKDATQKYTTTWFDMFRLENGKIAEHWDPALKK